MAFKDNAVELEERVVAINRVTKVVKGGRRLRFAALVVVGDRNGRVGFGTGKARRSSRSNRKAVEDAKKNLDRSSYGWNNNSSRSNISIWWSSCIVETSYRRAGVAAGGAVQPLSNWQVLQMLHLNHLDQTLQSTSFVQLLTVWHN